MSVSAPNRSAWDALTRDDEFAVLRTLWLARWADMEQANEDLRDRVAWYERFMEDSEAFRSDYHRTCYFETAPQANSLGVANPRGGTCSDEETCMCAVFCSRACAEEEARNRGGDECPDIVQLRGVGEYHRCFAYPCDVRTQCCWVYRDLLPGIRRRYWPADVPVPLDTPNYLK